MTPAGRKLLAVAARTGASGAPFDLFAKDIDAIEREAAAAERERIRALDDDRLGLTDTQRLTALLIDIDADSSPSASAEPDGEPSE